MFYWWTNVVTSKRDNKGGAYIEGYDELAIGRFCCETLCSPKALSKNGEIYHPIFDNKGGAYIEGYDELAVGLAVMLSISSIQKQYKKNNPIYDNQSGALIQFIITNQAPSAGNLSGAAAQTVTINPFAPEWRKMYLDHCAKSYIKEVRGK